ncbi:hypothetical protein ACFL4G_09025 [Thermodesulfobacteriota bacterium]
MNDRRDGMALTDIEDYFTGWARTKDLGPEDKGRVWREGVRPTQVQRESE